MNLGEHNLVHSMQCAGGGSFWGIQGSGSDLEGCRSVIK